MLRTLMKRWQRDERGFTLIELMIVILVILVLAAILIPQFGIARERARKATCVSNQRNLETSIAMWQTDNPSTNLKGGTMAANSIPTAGTLSGTPQYTVQGTYVEPDDSTVTTGADYYLSNGESAGTQSAAVPTNPSYGHVACAFDGVSDGWVAGYDTANATAPGSGYDHRRGAQASP